jgi:aspartokinase
VNIKAENSKALVSLVAEDIRRLVGLPVQVLLALDGIEVWMASPGASQRSFSFVISEKDVPEVVRRLHESLLEDNCSLLAVNAEQIFAPAAVV